MGKTFLSIQMISVLISCPGILSQSNSSVVLSEIMFCAESGNNEFVELFNLSETDSADINGYCIQYYTSSPDKITDAGYGTVIPPGGFAVILENDYDISEGNYKNIIPPSALILKIADNSFGSSGMSNSTGRTVKLLNAEKETIDSCCYTADNPKNISEEKIIIDSDEGPDQWINGTRLYGTPGFSNSVTPYQYDLKLLSLILSPSSASDGRSVEIEVKIINAGLSGAGRFDLDIYDDLNKDSVFTADELISGTNYSELNSNDSVKYITVFKPKTPGIRNIIAVLNFSQDQNLSNNELAAPLNIFIPEHEYNDVIVNEIMYAPQSGEPEWMELYNLSDKSINLNGFTISDNSTAVIMTKNDFIINPDSYAVVCKDSSLKLFYNLKEILYCKNLPSLNNTGDKIMLIDSLGTLMDSVYYKPEWGGKKGKSLERKNALSNSNDSSNWASCRSANNGTPGIINSVSKKDYDIAVTGIKYSPGKPLYGDDVSLSAVVKNTGRFTAGFALDLYEDSDLDSVYENHISTEGNFTIQPGDSLICRLNYIIRNINSEKSIMIKADFQNDQDNTDNFSRVIIKPGYNPSVVLINEIMANPAGGEPEWIELFNTSDQNVDMGNWTVNDVLTTPYKAHLPGRLNIPPKSYIILTSDTSIINYHRNIPCKIITVNLPLFNNDKDGAVLKDDRNVIIDSMFYGKENKLIKGYSLERRSLTDSTLKPGNWAVSIDNEQSTPGRINSIAKKSHDLLLAGIFIRPLFPVEGDDINIEAKVLNIGESYEANYKAVFYYNYGNANKVYTLLSEEYGNTIAPGDSMVFVSSAQVRDIKDGIIIYCSIICPGDEDTVNNRDTIIIRTGWPEGIVKINEIMYAPDKSESEWFELVNTSGTDSINLQSWSVSEILPSQKKISIADSSEYIGPGKYLILCKDKNFPAAHPGCPSKIKIINFGTLGNTSDGIVIYDARGMPVDSVFYNNAWGGGNGRSLERIKLYAGSNDSTNWRSSLSGKLGTPGFQNSVVNLMPYKKNSIIINEIMYEPSAGNSEYIELLNISGIPVDIKGWIIDDPGGGGEELTGSNLLLLPEEYFVIASDSMLFKNYEFLGNSFTKIIIQKSLSLSNSGEPLILMDALGNKIDSVYYLPGWHNKNFISAKNISLERINPFLDANNSANWSSSTDKSGGTPCQNNSIYTVSKNRDAKLSVSPNPFSPDNDGFEDFTIIKYRLNNLTAQIRIRIFNSRGYLVRTLANCAPSGSEGAVVFDGRDDNNNPLRIGIYIILLDAFNENSGILESMKTVVVVARKL